MTNIDLLKAFQDDTMLERSESKFADLKHATDKTRMKSTQDPQELRRFLQHLRTLSIGIESYFEVGCSGGGTYYYITSFLKARNDRFRLAIANDIRNKVRRFNEFTDHMYKNDVQCIFSCENSHKIKITGKYHLVFIDANHSFEGVMTDYVKWKDHAKYLAFHDVAYRGEKRMCGVPSAWVLIKQNYTYTKEFVNLNSVYPYPQGIGVIHTDTEIKVPTKEGTMVNPNKDWWSRYGIK